MELYTGVDNKSVVEDSDENILEASNRDVISKFVSSAFPKSQDDMTNHGYGPRSRYKTSWGSENLKIEEVDGGFILLKYATPLAFKPNDEDVVYLDTTKYSVSTSKIQSYIGAELSQSGLEVIKISPNKMAALTGRRSGRNYTGTDENLINNEGVQESANQLNEGTGNFARGDASKIYAVGMRSRDDEGGDEEYEDSYEVDTEIEDTIDNVKSELQKYNEFSEAKKGTWSDAFGRSYDAKVIGDMYSGEIFEDEDGDEREYGVNFECLIINGYYDGANLDYLITYQIDGYEGDFDEFTAEAQAWVENKRDEFVTKIEEVYKMFSIQLGVSARFSNGETWYSRVQESIKSLYNRSKTVYSHGGGKILNENINVTIEARQPTSISDIQRIVQKVVDGGGSFMEIGNELRNNGIKYEFAFEPITMYMIKNGSETIAICNKKYVEDADTVVGNIAIGKL